MRSEPCVGIRRARPEDLPRVLELVKATLGKSNPGWSEAFWRWKHQENPFGESPVLIAEVDGELVGLRAFLRWKWRTADRIVDAVRAVDTITHPSWRGQGIFTRLTLKMVEEMTEEGVAFVFNTPNDASRPGYLKMGWSEVGRLPLRVRPVHPIGTLRRFLGLGSRGAREPTTSGSVSELLREPDLDRFLCAREDGDERYRTPVDPGYLAWRYERNPSSEYHAEWDICEEDGAIAVYRTRARGRFQGLRLCELLVGRSRESVTTAGVVLRHILTTVDADFAAAMAASGSREARALLRSGFLPALRIGPMFTARPLSLAVGSPDPRIPGSWGGSIGALELF